LVSGRFARWVLALLLAAHGVAHFVAVARIVRSIGLELPLALFGGLVVTRNWAIAVLLALTFAAAGTGFLAASRLLVGREQSAGPLLMAVASLSLLLTAVGLWATLGGIVLNLAVLTVVPGISRSINDQRSAQSVFF
jgi:hypothetical protein